MNRCVACGAIIPEGKQVCMDCLYKAENKEAYPEVDFGEWQSENKINFATKIKNLLFNIKRKMK